MVPDIQSETDIILCHIGQFFALVQKNSPKNQYFEKMKKMPGDNILHVCTINYDQMIYGS